MIEMVMRLVGTAFMSDPPPVRVNVRSVWMPFRVTKLASLFGRQAMRIAVPLLRPMGWYVMSLLLFMAMFFTLGVTVLCPNRNSERQ